LHEGLWRIGNNFFKISVKLGFLLFLPVYFLI